MPRCTIYNEDGDIIRDFDTEDTQKVGAITVGRSSQCTISLKKVVDRHVGRIHFSLQREGKSWTITNCSSTALYKNEQEVTTSQLQEGDIVRFGHTFLAFGADAGPSPYELAFLEEEGYETRLALWPGRNTVGASSENTLCIKELGLSRSHARIVVNPQGLLVEDAGSSHGTYLDGALVKSLTSFQPGATIRLGKANCQVLRRGEPMAKETGKAVPEGRRGFGKWIAAALAVLGAVLLAKLCGWL